MMFEKINLSPVCNHKLFYDAEPALSQENGLDGIYILRKDLQWGEEENLGGPRCFFFRSGSTIT